MRTHMDYESYGMKPSKHKGFRLPPNYCTKHSNLTTHPKVPPLQLTGRERSLGRGRAAPSGFCAQGQGTIYRA